MTTKHFYWLAAIVIMILISFLSTIPNLTFFNNNLPPELLNFIRVFSFRFGSTGFFSYGVSIHPDYLIHKIGHIVLFSLLGTFLYMATDRSVKWALLLVVVFAISDELHQGFVVGRSSRFGDIVLDTVAAASCLCILDRKRSAGRKQRGDGVEK